MADIIGLPQDRLYAGLLLKATEAQLAFWRKPRNATVADLVPYGDVFAEDFDGPQSRDKVLYKMAYAISQSEMPVSRLGIASYGPLLSVARGHDSYGTVSPYSPHVHLKGFGAYTFIKDALARYDCECPAVVQTDVMCGAIHEAYARASDKRPSEVKQHAMDRVLVFIHLAETGVGGGVVVGNRPMPSGQHPEMGYIPAQILVGDKWAEGLRPKGDNLVSVPMEWLISGNGLLKRTRKKALRDIPLTDWETAGKYLAQLCASATFMFGPHQIVLHGPVIDQAFGRDEKAPFDLVHAARVGLKKWLIADGGPALEYSDMNAPRFIDHPLSEERTLPDGGKGIIDPMLKGAAYLAAQTDY